MRVDNNSVVLNHNSVGVYHNSFGVDHSSLVVDHNHNSVGLTIIIIEWESTKIRPRHASDTSQ